MVAPLALAPLRVAMDIDSLLSGFELRPFDLNRAIAEVLVLAVRNGNPDAVWRLLNQQDYSEEPESERLYVEQLIALARISISGRSCRRFSPSTIKVYDQAIDQLLQRYPRHEIWIGLEERPVSYSGYITSESPEHAWLTVRGAVLRYSKPTWSLDQDEIIEQLDPGPRVEALQRELRMLLESVERIRSRINAIQPPVSAPPAPKPVRGPSISLFEHLKGD